MSESTTTAATGTAGHETASTGAPPPKKAKAGAADEGFLVEAPGSAAEPDAAEAEKAAEQYKEDLAWMQEHPNEPLIRGPIGFGGEAGAPAPNPDEE
jgi:hypothetical protein